MSGHPDEADLSEVAVAGIGNALPRASRPTAGVGSTANTSLSREHDRLGCCLGKGKKRVLC